MKYILRRFLALYMDSIIILILNMIIYVLYNALFKEINLEDITHPSTLELFIGQLISFMSYFLFTESLFLTTIGKRIMNLKISLCESSILSHRVLVMLKRNISKLIPFDAFSIFFRGDKKMWHDILSDTSVEIISTPAPARLHRVVA